MRTFESGATRDTDDGKYDFEGFLAPAVLQEYAAYMHRHRKQADGKLRASDNWQKGIPRNAYMKSAWRHFYDWWQMHRGRRVLAEDGTLMRPTEPLCALLFNTMGYLFELLRERENGQTTVCPCGGTCNDEREVNHA